MFWCKLFVKKANLVKDGLYSWPLFRFEEIDGLATTRRLKYSAPGYITREMEGVCTKAASQH